MSSTSHVTQFLAIAALPLAFACKPEPAQTPEYDTTAREPAVQQPEDRGAEPDQPKAAAEPMPGEAEDDWQVTAVYVDVGLAELCGMETSKTYFEYDSAKLSGDAKTKVQKLANCFDTGALSGRDVVIIGHADPRGTDEYNKELGMSRAEAVAQALTREGLDTGRVAVESHGESHAHADPDEWPDDRRVEIQIAD